MGPELIEQLVAHLVATHGLRKVRLTGGDPTTRRDFVEIISRISAIEGIEELCATTNGLTLLRDAEKLKRAGLDRVNVSLDSLDSERFTALTGVRGLGRVVDGLSAAKAAGLSPKVNAVVTRGFNELELPALARFGAELGIPIRYIELMPMGPLAQHWRDRFVAEGEMRRILANADVSLGEDLPQGTSAARRCEAEFDDGLRGELGFITPMSCDFCARCDRLRVGSDGSIYPCLMDEARGTLLPALRPVFDPARCDELLAKAYTRKAPVHPSVGVSIMTRVGG
jgi:cyclic pyranopterin phosphate synthase